MVFLLIKVVSDPQMDLHLYVILKDSLIAN